MSREALAMSEPEDPLVWCCANCKSQRVQSQMWVRCNTLDVLDDCGRYHWCDACEEDGTGGGFGGDGELPYRGGIIQLRRSQSREGNVECV